MLFHGYFFSSLPSSLLPSYVVVGYSAPRNLFQFWLKYEVGEVSRELWKSTWLTDFHTIFTGLGSRSQWRYFGSFLPLTVCKKEHWKEEWRPVVWKCHIIHMCVRVKLRGNNSLVDGTYHVLNVGTLWFFKQDMGM